jgi:hypothetical protein
MEKIWRRRVGGGARARGGDRHLIVTDRSRLPELRQRMDAGANASVLPAMRAISRPKYPGFVPPLELTTYILWAHHRHADWTGSGLTNLS